MIKILIIFVMLSSVAFADTCSTKVLDKPYINYILQNLRKDQNIPPVFDYKISDQKIYLFNDSEFKGCSVIWDKGDIRVASLEKPELPANFDFCGGKLGEPCPETSDPQATGILFDLKFEESGFNTSVMRMESYAFLVHEGFHFFAQLKPFLVEDDLESLQSLVLEDRDAFEVICVNKTEVKRELEILKNALQLSYEEKPDVKKIKDLVKYFGILRRARFLNTPTIFEGKSCQTNEEIMEYLEGTAKFVERRVIFEAGLASKEFILESFNLRSEAENHYYVSGSIPLLIVYYTDRESFNQIAKRISTANYSSKVVDEVIQWAQEQKPEYSALDL